MSEKQILSLMKDGKKFLKKKKVLEALEAFNNVLEISPNNFDALNFKVQILKKLKRPKELFPAAFKLNLLKLQRDEGMVPSDYESPDSWIVEAIKLLNKGQDDLAQMYLTQAAYISPIVNSAGLSSMTFHANAKIYYFTAVIYFRKQKNYEIAMTLFEIANKLDPRLIIPKEIKNIYNDFISNRSGVGVRMIVPLNKSILRSLFPTRDKFLVSTEAYVEVKVHAAQYKKRHIVTGKTYQWKTHMILSDYALAFLGAKNICKKDAYYVPWPFINYNSESGRISISSEYINRIIYKILAAYSVNFTPISNPQAKSTGELNFQYINQLDIHSLIELNKNEMMERTINNLKSLEELPSHKKYNKQFEVITEEIYKDAVQTIKQSRM